jgi:hypothetical protein
MVSDQAAQSVLEGGHAEIHDEAKRQSGKVEVGENLFRVNRESLFNCLDLKDDGMINQQIDPVGLLRCRRT